MNETTNEDLQDSLSDNNRGLIHTSADRTQSAVYLSDHAYAAIVDTSNQIDTDDDCQPSYSACDTEVHVERADQRYSLYDNSRRLVQTSDNRTQSAVYLSDHAYAIVDISNQLDTDDDCTPSYSACNTEVRAKLQIVTSFRSPAKFAIGTF